jgi:pilus assembly protein CpaF
MSFNDEEDQGSIYEESIRGFLSPIWDFLKDESVTEVMINGYDEIFIEVAGKLKKTSAKFADEDTLRAAVNNIAQSVQRKIDDEEPRLDARLPNGFRIHAVLPPCARNGTTVAIRKFSTHKMSFKDLIGFDAITVDAAQFLMVAMRLGKNILVSGGTGSGKTTLLGVLCDHIPPGQRIIVIEDSSELQINYEHCVYFETRMANDTGKGAITIRDLLKSSLRLRPDRIIVGEVRGAEAMELVQAMNTGHKGCLGTVHANTADDAIVRLETLAQGADAQVSEKALKYQICGAIDIIIQASRLADGSRRIMEIAEVLGQDKEGNYLVNHIYKMGRLVKSPDGKLIGQIEPTGELPSFMDEIEDNKIPFSRNKFAA